MAVWCADGIAGRFCLEAADTVGIFHPFAGGGREACDITGSVPEKSMDGTVVEIIKLAFWTVPF